MAKKLNKTRYPFTQCTSSYCGKENGGTYEDGDLSTRCSECEGAVVTVKTKKQAHQTWEHMGI